MDENIITNMVRVGIVSDVDKKKRCVRVRFPNLNLTSDWLYVLKNPPLIPDSKDPETQLALGPLAHKHNLDVNPWLPAVNDKVLCLYIPVFNGDGFVLGAIG